MQSIKLIKEIINESKSIAILGHIEPDVDCLASAVAIKRAFLTNLERVCDKNIDIFANIADENEMLSPIVKGEKFKIKSDEVYDLAICIDCPTVQRMGEYATIFESAKNTILIDHHENNELFANHNFVYKTSSTCELIYILLKALEFDISNDVCKFIYAGIVSDTVNLTQGTIKVSSYKIIAEIAEKVNDMESLDSIKDYLLKNKTKSNLKLLERALHSMSFYLNDRVAVMKITGEDLKECGANNADTIGIVNNAINIKGVYIAVLFIKQEDGSYYASMRAKNGVDVSVIAAALGGGGHETVAAFNFGNNLSELKDLLLGLCEQALVGVDIEEDSGNLF